MNATNKTRRLAVGGAMVAVGAAGLTVAAPAQAYPWEVIVTSEAVGGPDRFVTGCEVDIAARVDSDDPVEFDVMRFGSHYDIPILDQWTSPIDGRASATFVPDAPGTYIVTVRQDGAGPYPRNITVGPGMNAGSVCFPM